MKMISRRASFDICVDAFTIMSARILFRSSLVEYLVIANLYSASKKVNLDSEIAESNEDDRSPSANREFRAEPTREITPSESKTVERMTLVARDWDSALRIPFMEICPVYAGPPAL